MFPQRRSRQRGEGWEDSTEYCQHFTAYLDGLLRTWTHWHCLQKGILFVCLVHVSKKEHICFQWGKREGQTGRMLEEDEFSGRHTSKTNTQLHVDFTSTYAHDPAYLPLCRGSWAQRICTGSCQWYKRGVAPWPALDHEVLQSEEHTMHLNKPK